VLAGLLRNAVQDSLTVSGNHMADPDANEVLANYVDESLTCLANTPAVQYGDSGSTPNAVDGAASGQRGFSRRVPDPSPNGTSVPATG
jgi:hypothetical protein